MRWVERNFALKKLTKDRGVDLVASRRFQEGAMLGFYSGYVVCLPKPTKSSLAGDINHEVARANPYLMHIQADMFVTPFPPSTHDPMHTGKRKRLDENTDHVFCFMNENIQDPESSKVKPMRDTLTLVAIKGIKNGSVVDMNYSAREDSVVYEDIRIGRIQEQSEFLKSVWEHVQRIWERGDSEREMSNVIGSTVTEASAMHEVTLFLRPQNIVDSQIQLTADGDVGRAISARLRTSGSSLREATTDMAELLTMLWRLQTDEDIATSDRAWWRDSSLMPRMEEGNMLVAMRAPIAPLMVVSVREKFKLRRPEEAGVERSDVEAAAELMLRIAETWKPEGEKASWRYCTKAHREVITFAKGQRGEEIGRWWGRRSEERRRESVQRDIIIEEGEKMGGKIKRGDMREEVETDDGSRWTESRGRSMVTPMRDHRPTRDTESMERFMESPRDLRIMGVDVPKGFSDKTRESEIKEPDHCKLLVKTVFEKLPGEIAEQLRKISVTAKSFMVPSVNTLNPRKWEDEKILQLNSQMMRAMVYDATRFTPMLSASQIVLN